MGSTIRDIAKMAGVSLATVSRVINNSASVKDETRARVMDAIKKTNFVPNGIARSLSTNDSNTIGVIVPDINNPFFGKVIKGISYIADELGYDIILCDTDESPKKEIEHLRNLKKQRIKGIIITPTSDDDSYNSKLLAVLDSMGVPITLIDRDVKFSNFDGVFLDNEKGAFDATNFLLEQGHEKIAIIAGPKTSIPGRDRLYGYIQALKIKGMNINEDLVLFGDFRMESGYENTKKILEMDEKPTAIFSCNNMMTLGAIKAIFEKKLRIPEDITLIGFDEIDIIDILGLQIPVVYRPTVEMGKLAMEILSERLNDENGGQIKRVILSPCVNIQKRSGFNE